MKIPAMLGAAAALVTLAATPLAAHAATADSPWGPYRASGGAAVVKGTLKAVGEDHEVMPTADTVTIKGVLADRTKSDKKCGWVLMEFAIKVGKNYEFKQRQVRNCSYDKPKKFTFVYHDVYQVGLKVCAEPKASAPSASCRYGGSWKIIYKSPI
ncbi:hypothetical protein [Thermoactinospora rubra]|uniref:hypothetical protein n=1 Tax=Thermoactinospora rubra TaxID=1088767 RepID=UPI000A0F8D9E|nr:hypothetical protein [Thermoactinospora rubra]